MKFFKPVSENIIPKMCACKFFTAHRLLLMSLCAGIAAGVAVTPKRGVSAHIKRYNFKTGCAYAEKKKELFQAKIFLFDTDYKGMTEKSNQVYINSTTSKPN